MKIPTLKIGNVKLPNILSLAPLLGVNCPAFRLMCHNHKAGLIYSPMIHSVGLVKGDKNRDNIIDFIPNERPLSVQIVGRDPKIMAESLEFVEPYADIIDINFGCPDNDLMGQKMGAYFSKHPEQMTKIITKLKDSTNLPVTAKIRIGWDNQSINHIKQLDIIQDAGADAIAVHGRTKKQGYSGKANWTAIKQVKDKSDIPVIANGDIFCAEDARKLLNKTNADGLMIGRGAIGNPRIFEECYEFLYNNKTLPPQTEQERGNLLLQFINDYSNPKIQKVFRQPELKQQCMWFCTGSRGASQKRKELMICESKDELISKVKQLFKL